MRVITGTAKGKKLTALEGNEIRPTSDMIKEAIFSIIQFDIIEAVVLDLFAGSGQLGIEALSRGAKQAVFIDNNKQSSEVIKENLKKTELYEKSQVITMDASAFLASTKLQFDIVFLDPPYNQEIINKILPALLDKLSDNAIVICESDKKEDLPELSSEITKTLNFKKDYNHGKTKITIYKKQSGDENI